ncbi:MAG: GDP-mannose mannosyl hydrolase [Burkholderiaceae bacterium]
MPIDTPTAPTRHRQAPVPPLPAQQFAALVAAAPLISIDLLAIRPDGSVLLGWRTNPPAQNSWFVPGGRIRKGEMLAAALRRLAHDELGLQGEIPEARFGGVFEHFYDTDFRATKGATTHYLALAYWLEVEPSALSLPTQQHARYRWVDPDQILSDPDVHPYTRAYFTK